MTRRGFNSFATLALAGLLLTGGAADAQTRRPAPARPGAPTPPPPPTSVPQPIAILAMVRSTLLAIDHGNRTGNYTVLRDLSAPQFREANTAAKLSQIFEPLKVQGVDMLGVAVVDPVYTLPAKIDPTGKLHVRGIFQIPPRTISFEFLFEAVGGQWRLFAVSVQPI